MNNDETIEILRVETAIKTAISFLHHNLKYLYDRAMATTAKDFSDEIYETLYLIEIAQDLIKFMRGNEYTGFDDCVADFSRIGSLMKAIDKVYGNQNEDISEIIKRQITNVDVMLEMIDVTELTNSLAKVMGGQDD